MNDDDEQDSMVANLLRSLLGAQAVQISPNTDTNSNHNNSHVHSENNNNNNNTNNSDTNHTSQNRTHESDSTWDNSSEEYVTLRKRCESEKKITDQLCVAMPFQFRSRNTHTSYSNSNPPNSAATPNMAPTRRQPTTIQHPQPMRVSRIIGRITPGFDAFFSALRDGSLPEVALSEEFFDRLIPMPHSSTDSTLAPIAFSDVLLHSKFLSPRNQHETTLTSSSSQQYQCGICFESSRTADEETTTTENSMLQLNQCRHVFHESCLRPWVTDSHRSDCPICRESIVPRLSTSYSPI